MHTIVCTVMCIGVASGVVVFGIDSGKTMIIVAAEAFATASLGVDASVTSAVMGAAASATNDMRCARSGRRCDCGSGRRRVPRRFLITLELPNTATATRANARRCVAWHPNVWARLKHLSATVRWGGARLPPPEP